MLCHATLVFNVIDRSPSAPDVQVATAALAPERDQSTTNIELGTVQLQDEIIGPVLRAMNKII